jgi:hypothetical protein
MDLHGFHEEGAIDCMACVVSLVKSFEQLDLAKLSSPTVWCFAVNGIGAAVILPIYFWIQLSHRPTDAHIQLWNSAPLPFAFLACGVLPGLALVSGPLFPRSVATHQQIIAIVQASPLLIFAIQAAGSSLYPIRNLDIRRRRTAALPSLQQVLSYSAVFSGLAHLVILGHVILGLVSPLSIYLPSNSAIVSTSAADKLLQGAKYFLQWDLLGIVASTGLWCFYMISEISDIRRTSLILRLIGGNLLFGPGATTSAVLSWREEHNVEAAEAKRQTRSV